MQDKSVASSCKKSKFIRKTAFFSIYYLDGMFIMKILMKETSIRQKRMQLQLYYNVQFCYTKVEKW